MKIFEVQDQKLWDEFIVRNNGEFLHSWSWGQFKKSLGDQIYFLGVEKNGTIIAAGLVIAHYLILGKRYLYCPRGPIFLQELSASDKKEAIFLFLSEIQKISSKQQAVFFHWEPLEIIDEVVLENKGNEFSKSYFMQTHETTYLDLTRSAEELMSSFHHKTRYNIKLAEKKGVTLEETQDVGVFLKILRATEERQKIKFFSDEYFYNLQKFLSSDQLKLKIYLAVYQGEKIAADLILFWGKTAIYLYGGSTGEYKECMSPYLLHWKIIQIAKNMGCQKYDFWGIDKKKWPGLTRFKLGFQGQVFDYPQPFDLIFRPFWYFLYRFFAALRNLFHL